MNEIYIALPFVQFAISAFLGVLVLFSDPSDRLNRLFTLFLIAMAAWGITIFAMRDAFPDASIAYSRETWALAVIPFSSIFFLHFVLRYTRSTSGNPMLYAFYAVGIASAIFSFGGYTATEMVEKFYGFAPQLGWAFPLVLVASYPAVLISLVRLQRASKTETSVQRRRVLWADLDTILRQQHMPLRNGENDGTGAPNRAPVPSGAYHCAGRHPVASRSRNGLGLTASAAVARYNQDIVLGVLKERTIESRGSVVSAGTDQ